MYSSVGSIISVLCSIVTQKKSVIRPACVCVCATTVFPYLQCFHVLILPVLYLLSLSSTALFLSPPSFSRSCQASRCWRSTSCWKRMTVSVCVLLTELRDLIDTHRENYTSFQMLSLCLFNILLHLCAWVCPNSHPWPQCTGALGWVEALPSLCFIDRSHLCFFSPPLLQHSHFFRSFLPSFILIHAWFSCLLSLSSSSFVTYNKLY